MLIPLRHENMEGRRWPVITFTLIVLNILISLEPTGRWKSKNPNAPKCEHT